jgi:hypothetical protein
MPSFRPKENFQIRRIFGLAKPLNCGEDDLRELAADVSHGRVERLSMLNYDEANAMIVRLGGEPFDSSRTPRRTVNYHRQQAGVKQIAQPVHLEKMVRLADGRGISKDGLERLCRRMLKGNSWPRTTDETNKIIEALKAMNARDPKAKEVAR